MMIQTNYTEFSLCPPCSDKQDRCMNCGVSCAASLLEVQSCSPMRHSPMHKVQASARSEDPALRTAVPYHFGAADIASPTGLSPAAVPPPPPPPPAAATAPGPARYCNAHSRTERRAKTEPKLRECTACHMHIQTNYLEFSLCPLCSEKRDQCMLCGISASECRSFVPAPLPVKSEDISARASAASSVFGFACEPPLPPLPAAASLPGQTPQKYCSLHNRTDRRPKGEPRLRECTACHVQIQTNYMDFALCPPCSEVRDQCMICGSSCSESQSYIPAPLPCKAEDQTARGQGQVPPRFCCMHDTTHKRPKADPRLRECGSCRMMVQSNYADMALCPPCSDKEKRCMVCGGNAVSSGSCMLPPNILSPLPLPNLLSRKM